MSLRRGGERGQATVELALALPLVLCALLLVIQVAVVVRAQVLVVAAARDGARAAAVDPRRSTAAGAARSTPGLDPARLTVRSEVTGSAPAVVEVTVSYRVRTDVALVGALLGDPTVEASAAMAVEDPDSP